MLDLNRSRLPRYGLIDRMQSRQLQQSETRPNPGRKIIFFATQAKAGLEHMEIDGADVDVGHGLSRNSCSVRLPCRWEPQECATA